MTYKIVLAGRPNVGKSTLFNRIVGRRKALVSDTPGLTRDYREEEVNYCGLIFSLIDTAGIYELSENTLSGRMHDNSMNIITSADICLFIIDGNKGVTAGDIEFANFLRKQKIKTILVANKCEGRLNKNSFYEVYELGLGNPVAISAEHNIGIRDLFQVVEPLLAQEKKEKNIKKKKNINIVIIGRPNAGKSTLINSLVGSNRMLTGSEAGITRDSITIEWEWKGNLINLIDTAGLRKRSKVDQYSEKLARIDALRAIQFSDVVILLLDATKPMERQDLHLADLVEEEGRAIVVAVNKCDLIEDKDLFEDTLTELKETKLSQIKLQRIIKLIASEGFGNEKLMESVFHAYEVWNKRITTGALNNWLNEVLAKHQPPAKSGKRIKLRYITQISARPPTFVIFCSYPDSVPDSYKRFLVNELRVAFNFPAVAIRIHLRKGKNPFEDN
jgi:GTPase